FEARAYEGDEFPKHWNDLERKTAAQQYASVPEEFYSRTKRKPITPANFGSWFSRTRGRGLRWHMQELCSGSGRLSLVAVLSGLLVGFPVDYRYGWDLTVPAHQAMIAQAREEFLPAYLHASPSSTAWSNVSKLTPLRQTRRDMDSPMLSFLKGLFVEQTRQDLRFCVEQPMNSTMFQDKTSPLSDLCDLPGVRRRQQVDQCAHGCADEHGVPMKKATVIVGNLKMSRTTKRCNGHKGRAHSVPQGFVNGVNKAAKAMVYPRQMCMAMVEDVWKFVSVNGANSDGLRYLGWSTRSFLENVVMDGGQQVEASLYFKYLMFVLVQDTVALFSEATERGIDYVHWVTDPVHKTMFQEIFQKELGVKAIACALRLQISGTVKKWKVHELEDLRLLSHSQQHQKIDEVDWLITLFGSDPAGTIPATPAGTIPSTPAGTIPSTPAGAIPSTPSKASHRRKAPVDRAEDLPAPASQDRVEEPIGDGDEQPEETFEGIAEEQRPYKVSVVGWLLDCRDGQHLWRRASNMFPQYEDVMAKATLVARHLSDRPFGGIAFGQGVRYLRPPPHSIGILMFWSLGANQYASQEHWSSTTIKLKDLVPFEVESLCFVYLYYYHHMEDEPRPSAKIETESSTAPMELESLEPSMDSTELMDVKRKGPETRTVVLGPESKRLRTDLLVMAAVNETELEAERYLPQLHFMLSAQNRFKVDFQHQLISACNMPVYSLLDSCMMKHYYGNFEGRFHDHGRPLVSWPGKKHENFLVEGHPILFRRLPQLLEYDEDTILESDDSLIKNFVILAAANAMKISKPLLVASVIASQTRLVGASSTTSTTSSTPSTTSSWWDYDFVLFWIITAIVIIVVERVIVHGGHHAWSWFTRLIASWTSSSTSSATSSASSTRSTSTQTEYVGIYTLVQERRLKNELEAANKQLELYRGNVATSAENDLIRRLRATEHQVADLQRRIRDHFSSCPAGKRLFCAQYS
ncbi:unnamed protein product, partial [Symbiodinium necroappetens]